MSPDSDEADLYPPDVAVVTKDAASQRNRAIVGVSLVTIGCGLMLERILDNGLDYFWLAIGFGLLAGWAKVPRFPMFAAGAIFTGFGLGGLIESLGSLRFESTISLLLATAGFLAVYVRYPKAGRWALIPAAIFGALAFADFGVGIIGLIPGAVTGMLLPLVLIGAGVLLVFRNRLPRKVVSCGVVVAAVVFVSAAASSIDEWHQHDPNVNVNVVSRGRTVGDIREIRVDITSGHVTVEVEPGAEPSVTLDDGRGMFGFLQRGEGELLVVGNALVAKASPSEDRTVVVPPGFPVTITTTSGDVDGEYGGGDMTVTTTAGDVDLVVSEHALLDAPERGLAITTSVGDVDFDASDQPLRLSATTHEGDLDVGDEEQASPFLQERPGVGVVIETETGDIDVEDLRPAA